MRYLVMITDNASDFSPYRRLKAFSARPEAEAYAMEAAGDGYIGGRTIVCDTEAPHSGVVIYDRTSVGVASSQA